MNDLFNKSQFEENARRIGVRLIPASYENKGGIYYRENSDDEYKELTIDDFKKEAE